MSEFPALRESLVRAAARRRRRRLTFRAAVPAFALAVAVVVLFLVPGGTADREREIATPAPRRTPLEQAFGVFRRERTKADAVPPIGGTLAGPDWDNSRLLAKGGGDAFYAVPSSEGLCLILLHSGASAGTVCGRVEAMAREGALPGTLAGGHIAYLFPDGSSDVHVTLRTDERLRPEIRDNAILVRGELAMVAWTGASHRRFIYRMAAGEPVNLPDVCPGALGELPADAEQQAARAALLAVEDLYPDVRRASVTSVKPATGTPCSAAVTQRTIAVELFLVPNNRASRTSASLTQGRLLVGMVNGHMQVFYLMH